VEHHALFRLHSPLNDFPSASDRHAWVKHDFNGCPSVKDAIEAIGVPHPEIRVILIDGRPVDFTYNLVGAERVEVFPPDQHPAVDQRFLLPVRPPHRPTFILDVHLGGLARYLRLAGFDSLYSPTDWGDEYIATTAQAESRIVLTRDVGLLKRSSVRYGRWLRHIATRAQFQEVVEHYDLRPSFRPFSRCTHCNGPVTPIDKTQIANRVAKTIYAEYSEFSLCQNCHRVYWKGSHYDRIRFLLNNV